MSYHYQGIIGQMKRKVGGWILFSVGIVLVGATIYGIFGSAIDYGSFFDIRVLIEALFLAALKVNRLTLAC